MHKNRIIYVLFLCLAVTFSYFYPGVFSSVIFYSVLFIPLASIAYAFYIYSRFCYIQSVDKKFVTKGEKVHYIVEIVNETKIIYPYIEILFYGIDTVFNKHFEAKKIAVLPKSTGRYQFDLECQYRGYYETGLKEIQVKDFLGFLSLKHKVLEPKYITVYPRIAILETFWIGASKFSDTEGVLMGREEDYTLISDIRRYAYGDSLKRVHWKLSAKKNEIMAKNYESTASMGATILLDLTKNPYDILENTILEDKVIEVCVAIVHYCLLRNIETHLVYQTQEELDWKTAHDYSRFEEFYNLLFKIKFESEIPFNETIQLALNKQLEKNSIIFITSNLNEQIYSKISMWHELNDKLAVVYVSSEQLVDSGAEQKDKVKEILRALQEMNVKTYEIQINDEIKYILEC